MHSSLFLSILLLGISTVAVILGYLLFIEKRKNNQVLKQVAGIRNEADFQRERLKVLSEAAFEGIVLLEDGVCLLMNSRAEEIFGYRSEEIIGLPTTVLIAREFRQEVRKNIDGQFNSPYEVEGLRKDGSRFPLAIYGKSLEYRGRVVRAAALRDLTLWKKREEERVTLEEQLRRSQKMESLGLMAGGVAHDLNNILSGLVTYPELLLLNIPGDDPLYEPLKAIRKAGERASDVVADLLTVARGVAMVIKVERLNSIIQNYLNSPEYDKLKQTCPRVAVRCDLERELPNILGSAVHVGKCLMNLVTNSAEAIAGEGTVTIRTYSVRVGEDSAAELQIEPGRYAVMEVSDDGPGIPAKDLEHIFEPFYSRKVVGRSGTGLGLAVVWNTMQDHKGCVQLESDQNGSCFSLYFPVTESEYVDDAEESISLLKGDGETILVVDDEQEQLAIASQILRELGYRARVVESGEKAVSWLEDNDADLLILDMMMGDGMNGYETYLAAAAIKPGQKALIASGFSESEEVIDTLRLGAGLYIKKPYSVSQLGRAIQQVLLTDVCTSPSTLKQRVSL